MAVVGVAVLGHPKAPATAGGGTPKGTATPAVDFVSSPAGALDTTVGADFTLPSLTTKISNTGTATGTWTVAATLSGPTGTTPWQTNGGTAAQVSLAPGASTDLTWSAELVGVVAADSGTYSTVVRVT